MGDPDVEAAHQQEDRLIGEQVRLRKRAETAEAERDRLRIDAEEYDQVLSLLRDLLAGTANALEGTPPGHVWHDWSDLPAVATNVVAERDRLRAVVDADDGWAGVITEILLTIDGGRREWSHPIGEQVVTAVAELEAERGRLRAIVDIVRDAFLRSSDNEWKIDSGALVVLADALDALDGSGVIGAPPRDEDRIPDNVWHVWRVDSDDGRAVHLHVGPATIVLPAVEAHELGSALHATSGIDAGSELPTDEPEPSHHVPDAEVGREESVGVLLSGPARPVQGSRGPTHTAGSEGIERETLEGQHVTDDIEPKTPRTPEEWAEWGEWVDDEPSSKTPTLVAADLRGWHTGRSWAGHAKEDSCPCPKAPCGLADGYTPGCPEHDPTATKTIRQRHRAEDCPGTADQDELPTNWQAEATRWMKRASYFQGRLLAHGEVASVEQADKDIGRPQTGPGGEQPS